MQLQLYRNAISEIHLGVWQEMTNQVSGNRKCRLDVDRVHEWLELFAFASAFASAFSFPRRNGTMGSEHIQPKTALRDPSGAHPTTSTF